MPSAVRRATMADYVGGVQQDSATYGYDLNSNLTSVATTGPASQTVRYLYNFNNDPICVSYPVDVTGGGCGTLTAQGTASGTASTTNTITTMGYNNGDQMTSLTDWLGNTTNFTYNQTGLASGITYPTSTGSSVGLTYDAAQNVTGEYATTAAGTDTTSWTPNPNNLISSVTLPGQTTSNAYSYNAWNQDDPGPVKQRRRRLPPPETTYGYYPNGSICYSDPAGGSGACDAPPPPAATYGCNGFSQLCYLAQGGATGSCVTPPSGAETFPYNADGQRTLATGAGPGGSNLSYGWNAQGTLCWEDPTGAAGTCSAPPSTATTYEYNGDGLRVAATPGGQTQAFTWDTATTSIPRIIMDGQNAYLYGPGVFGSGTAPIEQITLPTAANNNTQTPSYLISDPTGVREVIDGSGTTQTTDCYSAYGTQTTTGSGTTTPFGFQGGYTDPTGLVHLVDRYYDPSTGQFLSVDPLVDLTGQPYGFVGGEPASGQDPLGLWGWNPIASLPNNTGGKAVHWVKTHPEEAIGIGLGIVSVVTGGAGFIVDAGIGSVLLSGAPVGTGIGATLLDDAGCRNGLMPACVGMALGAIGAIAGGGPLVGSIFNISGESTVGALLRSLLGGFSINFGLAGLTVDIATVIAGVPSRQACQQ